MSAGARYVLLLLLAACDAVGDPLVGEREPPGAGLAIRCPTPPPCHPEWDVIEEVTARPWSAVDLAGCRERQRHACVEVDDAVEVAVDEGPDGGVEPGEAPSGRVVGCRLVPDQPDGGLAPDEVPCGPEPTLECERLEINAAADGSRVRHLEEPVWLGAQVRITTERAFTVELRGAWLFDVAITLQGPVTLRIVDARYARDVRIRRAAGATDGPRLELEAVVGARLRLGEPDGALAHVGMIRTQLTDVQLIASDLRLESTTLLGGLVQADVLLGLDADLADLDLRTQSSLLSAFKLKRSQLQDCQKLTLIGGEVIDTRIEACAQEPVRVYSTDLLRGAFDGVAEIDRSSWTSVVVGASSPTQLTAFQTALSGLALCPELRALSLSSVSHLRCSSCPDGMTDPGLEPLGQELSPCVASVDDLSAEQLPNVCFVPDPRTEEPTRGNYCDLPTRPRVCKKPHPKRTRPLEQGF